MAENVLTLIAAAEAAAVVESAADAIALALAQLGATVERRDWLAPRSACDIAFSDVTPDQADAAARAVIARDFGAAPIDVLAQPLAGRKKSLLVADMEATTIANEMLDELADLCGLRDKISAITARAMNGE